MPWEPDGTPAFADENDLTTHSTEWLFRELAQKGPVWTRNDTKSNDTNEVSLQFCLHTQQQQLLWRKNAAPHTLTECWLLLIMFVRSVTSIGLFSCADGSNSGFRGLNSGEWGSSPATELDLFFVAFGELKLHISNVVLRCRCFANEIVLLSNKISMSQLCEEKLRPKGIFDRS